MISLTDPVHIIAEAGTNHNGSTSKAMKLVDLAKSSGADSVKFQIIDPDKLYLPGKYEFGKYDVEEIRKLRRRFALQDDEYRSVADYAIAQGIPISASVFDDHGIELLSSLNPPYIKIASTDLNNLRLLRKAATSGLRLIVSTGMSSLCDIERSVNTLVKAGCDDVVLMHCVSVYPASLEIINLSFIDTLRSAFGFPVGFSDHTEGSSAACMALTKGVAYIEKHFTYDRSAEGFDHAYACEGPCFEAYVAEIRSAEKALKIPQTKLSEDEMYTRKRARRSLYAARELKAGSVITDEDVLVVRPENIMSADQIDIVVGSRLAADMNAYQAFAPYLLELRQ